VLDLSDGYTAKEVSFYGDSGLNSLCPADGISDPVKERKQALSCGSSSTTASRTGVRGSASGHPVVRTGDGTRSPASATDGEGATSLRPCRYRTGLDSAGSQEEDDLRREGRCLDKAVWVEGDRKSHIAGPVGARGLEELGMEDDDEEASSRDRKSGAGEDRGHSS